jgi:S-adenosylmethionine/arginine decarboxylase-like enzyme
MEYDAMVTSTDATDPGLPDPPAKRKRGRPRKEHPLPQLGPMPRRPEPEPAGPAASGKPYGKELILDVHGADPVTFTRPKLTLYMKELCELIDMEREDLHFWDYEDYPDLKAGEPLHLQGTSAVQFIRTSNITIHTLDQLRKVFVNIFSCKDFEAQAAAVFTANYFKGTIAKSTVTERL